MYLNHTNYAANQRKNLNYELAEFKVSSRGYSHKLSKKKIERLWFQNVFVLEGKRQNIKEAK